MRNCASGDPHAAAVLRARAAKTAWTNGRRWLWVPAQGRDDDGDCRGRLLKTPLIGHVANRAVALRQHRCGIVEPLTVVFDRRQSSDAAPLQELAQGSLNPLLCDFGAAVAHPGVLERRLD